MIRNKKTFFIGLFLLISFVGVYALIMAPIYGKGLNGLQFADAMFNSMSKGSAYFIQDQMKKVEKYNGKNIEVTLNAQKAEDTPEQTAKRVDQWVKLYQTNGAGVTVNDTKVTIKGDLGKILTAAIADSDAMYNNQGDKIKAKYGFDDSKQGFKQWYNSFKEMDKALKNNKMFEEAATVTKVSMSTIEPAYNYYGVEVKHVNDNIPVVASMLIFYLLYTVWYGFGLYYLFDGLGITTSKSSKKAHA